MQNVLLCAAASLISLALAELALRWLMPVYDYRDRSLLFSSPAFKSYSGGSVRYHPEQKIREVAVYNNKIEYDVVYATNNYGFIDSRAYRYEAGAGKKAYAFVGDSFTAGVNSGNPWVPNLRKYSAGAGVYNLGVGATGFEHFYRVLHEMKGRLNITHIVIVAITDDLFRGYWHPLEIEDKISFCNEGYGHTRCRPVPVAGIIPLTASAEEVMQISKKTYREIRATVKEIRSGFSLVAKMESALYDDSTLYYYTRVLLDTYNRERKAPNIEGAADALRQIIAEYPAAEIHLIHLPQKYEVKTKNYQVDIGKQIASLGVHYYPALEKCSWSLDMFFPHDGHPNAQGYENITRCVSGYLFGQKSDAATGSAKE
jgi:hypothetical protein